MAEPIQEPSQYGSVADARARDELLGASDATIEDAMAHGDPMVLRGLIHQLTGDPEIAATKPVKRRGTGLFGAMTLGEEDAALVRRKAAEFLKSYRDSGAGELGIGPADRLLTSTALTMGAEPEPDAIDLWLEELALNPWARGLEWSREPTRRREDFSVTVIGAGMGGLNAAIQLKRAGIPFSVIEKNGGVGGTWYENRYPGARVDTPSRLYTHVFGVDYSYAYPFCPWTENRKYFDWVADTFEVRGDITFDTEVRSLAWDEAAAMWDITVDGPEGRRTLRSNAVITAVGFLNRPNMPEIPGMERFRGPSWHSARWPAEFDPKGKRVAVVGTGCTGIQMVPELALEAGHVTVFQRTPQWLFGAPGYRSPFPSQVPWLDRNLPYHTNFMRLRIASGFIAGFGPLAQVDPHFDDEHATSPVNKAARDNCIAFLQEKLADPDLVEKMTPEHPVLSARPVLVDPEYSILDAIRRDNVTLVSDGIRGIAEAGVETEDGRVHEVDAIVYATGFKATEYLFPMSITGRGGRKRRGALVADRCAGLPRRDDPRLPQPVDAVRSQHQWRTADSGVPGDGNVLRAQVHRAAHPRRQDVDRRQGGALPALQRDARRAQPGHGVERSPCGELLLDQVWPLRDAESADAAGGVERAAGAGLRGSRRALTPREAAARRRTRSCPAMGSNVTTSTRHRRRRRGRSVPALRPLWHDRADRRADDVRDSVSAGGDGGAAGSGLKRSLGRGVVSTRGRALAASGRVQAYLTSLSRYDKRHSIRLH